MDESQILLNVANDDIPDADGIRIAVKVDEDQLDLIQRYARRMELACMRLHCRTYGI